MTSDNPKHAPDGGDVTEERPFFSAVLTPYRSLGPNGFLALMLCTGALCIGHAVVFLIVGAWPIVIFFGLDIALVWLAFRLNYAAARASEEVSIYAHEIVIRKIGPGKRRQEFRFNTFWVRLTVDRLEDEGVTRILLTSRGQAVPVGDFLNPPDRTSFASALTAALAAAKAGRPVLAG
ncbi:DUF2244 domain-containing protein [Microvirga tunisiensis]|uniref:DUF2244 domain-containing protein n=2 Tax=Pannonibacter tanglangensis TaxID=2750084 RepID=A0A7X5F5I8_9HYPH|nr:MULTISPECIES: DUF2244 domain-containing protein [unclassified Pannonibacter]NBN65608.1 DUF2244 domain-containing protein [Pannonibacter sp. XCT-34]NBN80165.1 DUF2244 domain-containing protein [Pannonibacter sp. XCT-53]